MDNLVVRCHPDASDFLARAQGFLEKREAENVLMLGLASSSAAATHLLTVERGPDCVMAGLVSGANLILSRGPASAAEAIVEATDRR